MTTSRRRLAFWLTGVLSVAVLIALGFFFLRPPLTTTPLQLSPTTSPAAPMTADAADAAAQEAFDRSLSGDFAGAWELYNDEARAAISQADYVKLNTACPGTQGVKATVVSARLEGTKAVVRIQLGPAIESFTLDYEHGRWLVEPSVARLAEYRLGVEQAIAARKAGGDC